MEIFRDKMLSAFRHSPMAISVLLALFFFVGISALPVSDICCYGIRIILSVFLIRTMGNTMTFSCTMALKSVFYALPVLFLCIYNLRIGTGSFYTEIFPEMFLAVVGEECVFRSLILGELLVLQKENIDSVKNGELLAVWKQAFLFCFVHLLNLPKLGVLLTMTQMGEMLFLGVFFGAVRLCSGSVTGCVLAHFLLNQTALRAIAVTEPGHGLAGIFLCFLLMIYGMIMVICRQI